MLKFMKDIVEIKHTLDGRRIEYPCRACFLEPPVRAIIYYVTDHRWFHRNPTIFLPEGTITLAYYWNDRPYNVYNWIHPTGETIGFYFNIARKTIINNDYVEWWDLTVDYWLGADGTTAFLDEEELPADLDTETAAHITRAKSEIIRDAASLADHLSRESQDLLPCLGSS